MEQENKKNGKKITQNSRKRAWRKEQITQRCKRSEKRDAETGNEERVNMGHKHSTTY